MKAKALDLNEVTLKSGSHTRRSDGLCVMEAVAYFAGEKHSDHPVCTCPVIAAFLRSWNDALTSDEDRTRLLVPLIPKVVDTRSTPEVEVRRAWMAVDWQVREFAPAWLDLAGLTDHAAALRALPPIVDITTAHAADGVLKAAREASAAAWAAAGDAARAAAWAAARAAAGDAAWAAARDAAWAAARDAAWDAAWAAARDAAWAKMKPTVDTLQASAVRLIERMITEVP